MAENQTYFVGVGAMKAGTSWLHDYLASRGDVLVPQIKELHYFNVRHLSEQSNRQRTKVYGYAANATMLYTLYQEGGPDAVSNYMKKNPFGQRNLDFFQAKDDGQVGLNEDMMWEFVDRLLMERDTNGYTAFFDRRLSAQHRAFGEITPAYSLLTQAGYQEIRFLYPHAKVIFLMRDPVERLVSQARFSGKPEMFESHIRKPGFARRGAYDVTWKNLVSVFPRDAIFVGFYETLFSDETIRKLCDFLSLPFIGGDYSRQVNRTRGRFAMTSEMREKALEETRHVYDFCFEQFGEQVPEDWRWF